MARLKLIWPLLLILTTKNLTVSSFKQAKPESRGQRDVPHSLNIGVGGPPPHYFSTNGEIRGSDKLIRELLAEKLDVKINVVGKGVSGSGLVEMVRGHT